MGAIVSVRDDYGNQTSTWFDFYGDALDDVATRCAAGVRHELSKVSYRYVQDLEHDSYTDLLNDARPTWSEMVDHWIWYFTSGRFFDGKVWPTNDYGYDHWQVYDIMHEMLGQHDAYDGADDAYDVMVGRR